MHFEIQPESIILKSMTESYDSYLHIKNSSLAGAAFIIKPTQNSNVIFKPKIGIMIPMQDIRIQVIPQGPGECTFSIEIFEFDWRKSIDEFKELIDDKKIKLIFTKMINIKVKEENITEETIDILDIIVYLWSVLGFIKIAKNLLL